MMTMSAVEQCQPQVILDSAQRWHQAGEQLSESAQQYREIGLVHTGMWEGQAANSADHRINSILNSADTSGWSTELIGTAMRAYGGALCMAKGVLSTLRATLRLGMFISESGVFTTLIPQLQAAAQLATTVAQTTLRTLDAMQAATGVAIESLARYRRTLSFLIGHFCRLRSPPHKQ